MIIVGRKLQFKTNCKKKKDNESINYDDDDDDDDDDGDDDDDDDDDDGDEGVSPLSLLSDIRAVLWGVQTQRQHIGVLLYWCGRQRTHQTSVNILRHDR